MPNKRHQNEPNDARFWNFPVYPSRALQNMPIRLEIGYSMTPKMALFRSRIPAHVAHARDPKISISGTNNSALWLVLRNNRHDVWLVSRTMACRRISIKKSTKPYRYPSNPKNCTEPKLVRNSPCKKCRYEVLTHFSQDYGLSKDFHQERHKTL